MSPSARASVVVLGPYPPSPDPAAQVVLDAVRALRAAGSTVTVVSPEPSAAPAHGDPTTWAGARRVAAVVRGADRVIWFTPDPAVPAPPLRRALASVRTVERRVIPPSPVGPGDRSLRAQLRRARAGAPTFVRTTGDRVRVWVRERVRSRAARARSGRRS